MKTLHIAEIKEVIGYGNSHPLRVKTEDNSTYVLKTRRDGTLADKNDYGIFIETLSCKLLQKFDFRHIPEIAYLVIDDDFIEDAKDKFEKSENDREQVALANIIASKGLNLGVKWIDNSEKYIGAELGKTLTKETINYDGYVMNSDRNRSNPNILFCRDDRRKYLIDFGGAFEMLMAFYTIEGDNAIFDVPQFYDKFCFDDDYLLDADIDGVSVLHNKISKDEITSMIDELPKEWEPHKIKDEIAYIISQRVGNKEIFKR